MNLLYVPSARKYIVKPYIKTLTAKKCKSTSEMHFHVSISADKVILNMILNA